MPGYRPGPRQAGIGAVLLLAAALSMASQAGADTVRAVPEPEAPALKGAIADALVGELAALSAFTGKRRPGESEANGPAALRKARQARAAIRAFRAAGTAAGAQESTGTPAGAFPAGPPAERPARLLPGAAAGLDLAVLDRVQVGAPSEDWQCLAEALYFEARGEGVNGQLAVAEVILNRVDSARYPDSVCDVVRQGAESGGACQFSYNCDGKQNRIANRRAYDRSGKIARLMLDGRPRTLTDEALFFHATSVSPGWSRKYLRTAQIGRHVFYRPALRLSQN